MEEVVVVKGVCDLCGGGGVGILSSHGGGGKWVGGWMGG